MDENELMEVGTDNSHLTMRRAYFISGFYEGNKELSRKLSTF